MSDFYDKIKDVLGDFATVDVVTLTGNVQLKPKAADGAEVKPEDFYKLLLNSLSQVEVVGVTHRELSFDAVNYVAMPSANITDEVRALHTESVESVMKSRQAILDFATGVAKSVVP